jgi:hypothetical protein
VQQRTLPRKIVVIEAALRVPLLNMELIKADRQMDR